MPRWFLHFFESLDHRGKFRVSFQTIKEVCRGNIKLRRHTLISSIAYIAQVRRIMRNMRSPKLPDDQIWINLFSYAYTNAQMAYIQWEYQIHVWYLSAKKSQSCSQENNSILHSCQKHITMIIDNGRNLQVPNNKKRNIKYHYHHSKLNPNLKCKKNEYAHCAPPI